MTCVALNIFYGNYRPQHSCGKVMFLQASVILFTGGGGCIQACTRADTPSWADTPLGRHPPRQTPPRQTPPTATAADGTHPTGMHSCFLCINIHHQLWERVNIREETFLKTAKPPQISKSKLPKKFLSEKNVGGGFFQAIECEVKKMVQVSWGGGTLWLESEVNININLLPRPTWHLGSIWG